MKRIVFITAQDAEYGFSLTGVSQYAIDVGNAEDVLQKILNEPDTGVVVLDERLIKCIGDERLREFENKWYGILLILPAPERLPMEEDYAMKIIKRAVGYHVRLG